MEELGFDLNKLRYDYEYSQKKDKTTEIYFEKQIDKIIIIPSDNYRTADFIFGKYSVNLDIQKACCETYDIYINGYDLVLDRKKNKKKKIINIKPSNKMVFLFGEKEYFHEKNKDILFKAYIQKNFLTILFDGGDRIRINRDDQRCGSYNCIYSRGVYLDSEEESKMIGVL